MSSNSAYPLVTVIVPNYNHAEYLQERLETIFNQSFQDFEVILLDDSSTDESFSILNEYKNHPKTSHLIVRKSNSGSAFKHWKTSLSLAKGKYIWMAESDDASELSFLEEMVHYFKKESNPVFVYANSITINEKSEVIGNMGIHKNHQFSSNKWSNDYIEEGIDEVVDFLIYKTIINNISAVLFKKESLLELDFKVLEKFKNAGDLFIYQSLALKGKIQYVAKPLNLFRVHAENFTKVNTINGLIYVERLRCLHTVLDFFQEYYSIFKPYKFRFKKSIAKFLNKNIFHLLKTNQKKELFFLFSKLKSMGIIQSNSHLFFKIGTKLYHLKLNLLQKLSRKILKTQIRKLT